MSAQSSATEARAIQVDAADLRAVGARLTALAQTLDGSAGYQCLDQFGDPLVSAAIVHAQADWSKKRKMIADFLVSAGDAITQSANAYAAVETSIVLGAGG